MNNDDIKDRLRQAGLGVGEFLDDGTSPTVTEAFRVTANIDTVPSARVPKRDEDALRRAQDLWLSAARQRGVVTPDGAFLTAAGLNEGWLRVTLTPDTDLSRLTDPSGGIEFLTRSPDGSRLCAISTEGGEHWVIDEAYPPADDEDD
ncbi:hypothetical protein ACWGNN_40045 [Streptomyces sp. NPDC055817]